MYSVTNNKQRDYFMDEARGIGSSSSFATISGYNQEIDTGTLPEDITTIGGIYNPPTAARIHAVTAGVNDVMTTGTGAWQVLIKGLDSNYLRISEIVNLNGTTPVNTVNSFLRINSVDTISGGSLYTAFSATPSNQGDITVTAAVDGTISALILANWGRYATTFNTVPAGETAYIVNPQASIIRNNSPSNMMATHSLLVKPQGGGYSTFGVASTSVTGSSYVQTEFKPYPRIPEKTDIVFRTTYTSDNNTIVSGIYTLIFYNN